MSVLHQKKQLSLSLRTGGETLIEENESENQVKQKQLFEEVLQRANILSALKCVEVNGGSAGVDGMSTKELRPYLRKHWKQIRKELLTGKYKPKPVKRVEIPKTGGGVRKLGIPCVLDRFIQQALHQVLQKYWDKTFSDYSFGFRPARSAKQAVELAQEYIHAGNTGVVDIDLEKFFDNVNHEVLLSKIRNRVSDKRIIWLIRGYLKAGILEKGLVRAANKGTPQGGPLSPLLSNLMLDELDQELENRGHSFVRYADDCNIYVASKRAGQRVKRSITKFLKRRLKLKVNESKTAVSKPSKRKFLGFSFTSGRNAKRRVAVQAIKRFKSKILELTKRTRGVSLTKVISDLSLYLKGWRAYFGFAQCRTVFKYLDSWIRRRLRSLLWKQWGRKAYRELRKRGVSRDLAWNTAKSAHGPWRLSRSPALNYALPAKYFDSLNLPRLTARI